MLKQITDISVVTIPMINKFQNTWFFLTKLIYYLVKTGYL